MDGALPISPHDFYERLGTARAPLVIDVRRQDAFDAKDTLIIGAVRRSPAEAGHDRQGRGHIAARPHAAGRRPARDLLRAVGKPRNAQARNGHVRRALHVVPLASGKDLRPLGVPSVHD
jgi:hypothetical protein